MKNTPLFIAKTPSTCNRNLDLGYLVNPSGWFYDDINNLATTSTTDHRQSDTIKTALYAKSFNVIDDTMVKGW